MIIGSTTIAVLFILLITLIGRVRIFTIENDEITIEEIRRMG